MWMKKYADIPKEDAQVLTPDESKKHLASLPNSPVPQSTNKK